MWRDTRTKRVRQKYDGQKVTNGYSKARRTQDGRQSVKEWETWIVKRDDCEYWETASQGRQDTSMAG